MGEDFLKKILDMIRTLQAKGNKPIELVLGRGAHDKIVSNVNAAAGPEGKIKYVGQIRVLFDLKVYINPSLPENRILLTYQGRIGGILDSVMVNA